jgi:uncharacterized protein (DUF1330 family)
MSAYILFTRMRTKDQSELDIYDRLAGPTLAGRDAQALAVYDPQEILEGGKSEGVVILSFPTRDAARAWYDSPAYQDARKHRMAGADYQVTLVEGV